MDIVLNAVKSFTHESFFSPEMIKSKQKNDHFNFQQFYFMFLQKNCCCGKNCTDWLSGPFLVNISDLFGIVTQHNTTQLTTPTTQNDPYVSQSLTLLLGAEWSVECVSVGNSEWSLLVLKPRPIIQHDSVLRFNSLFKKLKRFSPNWIHPSSTKENEYLQSDHQFLYLFILNYFTQRSWRSCVSLSQNHRWFGDFISDLTCDQISLR